jgi:immunity protein Imm1 of predicted polymorphic toxin system
MTEKLIVTAGYNGMAYPLLVARYSSQHRWLVDTLLREEGPHETWFYVSDEPVVGENGPWPRRWMSTGHHRGFGAAFFHDDAVPRGADWAWVAVNPEPLADAPTIFHDDSTPVIFPPVAVMSLERLQEVILEWCETGMRPTGVDWLAVNSQSWDLDERGNVLSEPARPRRTMHTVIRGTVVRRYGWGTDRVAPEQVDEPDPTWADHRTGRSAFGLVGPDETG